MKAFQTNSLAIVICLSLYSLVHYMLITISSSDPSSEEKTYIQYNIPQLNLDTFAEDGEDLLTDYLTKSFEWHVFPVSGATVAAKRDKDRTCSPIWGGFPRSDFTGLIAYRKESFFNSHPDISYILHYYRVAASKANDNGRVKLSLENSFGSSGLKDSFASKLIIESKNKTLVLNANEISKNIHRPNTTTFLDATRKQLYRIKKYVSISKKVDESLLPFGSTIMSKRPIISIEKYEGAFDSGAYTVSGYINEGEKGLIKIKVINRSNNKIIQDSGFTEGTDVEYVGWSTNPMQKFNFCLGVKLGARFGIPDTAVAEFQIWFKPADNSPERMLYSQTRTVDLWLHGK